MTTLDINTSASPNSRECTPKELLTELEKQIRALVRQGYVIEITDTRNQNCLRFDHLNVRDNFALELKGKKTTTEYL